MGELARALVTALTHEDDSVRGRAETRIGQWESVLRGMASGKLRIGSRKPVADFPSWVTLEVLRGGFATGKPAAGGRLTRSEIDAARAAEVPATRHGLFAWFLTEPGLRLLDETLSTGRYRVNVPEEAALLVAAWLGRAGDAANALALVEELIPFADEIRFAPTLTSESLADVSRVSRETVGDVTEALRRRKPNGRVEAMRETLMVWAPYADELLSLLLETVADGRVAQRVSDEWVRRARDSVDRYHLLAKTHTRCSKHRRPKENLAILRSAVESLVDGRDLSDRERGLLQHAVDSMVARRGAPGSDRHTALRLRQSRDASLPAHKQLATLTASRMSAVPGDRGTAEIEAFLGSVTAEEAIATGLPQGAIVPRSVRRIALRALEGTVESLIERGAIPSAEVLARLVPQIAAQALARRFTDPDLSRLMAAHYLAFRRRRTLLLLDLEHQVQLNELPWVRSVAAYGTAHESGRPGFSALRRLGELAIGGFPGTVFPNPLVREFDALGRESGVDAPFVEELAADIFMGTFSAKFLSAAQVAAAVLSGSLYERYYGIDYQQLQLMTPDSKRKRSGTRTSSQFAALCRSRSGAPSEWSVAGNGMVIEQAQILTTHNLASLAGPVGMSEYLTRESLSLASRSVEVVFDRVASTSGNPRPLGAIKDAAYAWRHMLFFLCFTTGAEQSAFVEDVSSRLAHLPRHVSKKLRPAVIGLDWVVRGSEFGDTGTPDSARRFLGWAADGHWMLAQPRADAAP